MKKIILLTMILAAFTILNIMAAEKEKPNPDIQAPDANGLIANSILTRDQTPVNPPFLEGFEVGNTDGSDVLNGWDQITGTTYTSKRWTANRSNTDYNRTPRTGSWNVFLQWQGQSCLVRPFNLVAGKTYILEFYARQDKNNNEVWVKAMLGTEATLTSMTQVIIAQKKIINGNYQQCMGSFSVATDGVYYLGIQGYILGNNSYYVSLDDISLTTNEPFPAISPSPASGAEYVYPPSVNLSWTNAGVVAKFDLYFSTDENAVSSFDPACRVVQNQSSPLNSYTQNGLDFGNIYYWAVVPKSAAGAPTTEPIPVWHFSTMPIYNLPWLVDFSAVDQGAIPDNWLRSHVNWGVSNSSYAGGNSPELKFSYEPVGTSEDRRATSPPLRGYSSDGLQVSFKHYIQRYATANYRVQISTDRTTWTNLWTLNPAQDIGPATLVVEIPLSYVGQIFYLAWTYSGNTNNTYGWWVDDIAVTAIPVMTFPWLEDFSGVTEGSIPATWTRTHDHWRVENTNNAAGTSPELRFYSDPTVNITFRAISPRLRDSSPRGFNISFKSKIYPYANASYRVDISTNKTTWTPLWTKTNPSATLGPETVSIDLPPSYEGSIFYLSWVYIGSSYNTYGWWIDDVSIEEKYDIPDGGNYSVSGTNISLSGGAANVYTTIPDEEMPSWQNSSFHPSMKLRFELFKKGPWHFTIDTEEPWGAYYFGGAWHPVENTGEGIEFTVNSAKAEDLYFVLGDQNITLPVELSSFTVSLTENQIVRLLWVVQSETNHNGYNILRSNAPSLSSAAKINNFLITTGCPQGSLISYNYVDRETDENTLYYYWLESVSMNGISEYYGPVSISTAYHEPGNPPPVIPIVTKLFDAFPNPFNPNTVIGYSLKEGGEVTIDIYNTKGQLVKRFGKQHADAGYYQVVWNGNDEAGKPSASGIYLYRMTSGKYRETKKMILSK